jgi:hypothetical protein
MSFGSSATSGQNDLPPTDWSLPRMFSNSLIHFRRSSMSICGIADDYLSGTTVYIHFRGSKPLNMLLCGHEEKGDSLSKIGCIAAPGSGMTHPVRQRRLRFGAPGRARKVAGNLKERDNNDDDAQERDR